MTGKISGGDLADRSVIPFVGVLAAVFLLLFAGGRFGPVGVFPLTILSLTIPAGRFILLFFVTGALSLLALLLYPRRLSGPTGFLLILACGLTARLLLISHPPSDDIYRYLWEGRLLAHGIDPYRLAPNRPELAGLARGDPFYPLINHPDFSAAYPPLAIAFFSLAGRIGYNPETLKVLLGLVDTATLCFILLLLEKRKAPIRWGLLYALSPVVVYAFAGQGHVDALQNFFLTGALVLYDRRKWRSAFLLAGLAVASKYVAVVALPFFFRKDNLKHAWPAALAVVGPLVPFLLSDGSHPFASLIRFAETLAFNGPVHGLLRAATGGIGPATTLCKILLAGALLIGYFRFYPGGRSRFRNDPVSGCFFSLGALILFSPTVHFWYLTWVLPFLAIRPFVSWMVLSLSIGFYFIVNGVFHMTGQWHLPLWARLMEWVPFSILFFEDVFLELKRGRVAAFAREPKTVSVVIPARNEAGRIRAAVLATAGAAAVCEVIVVDGGSRDRTVSLARGAGAAVIRHPLAPGQGGGRGGQIRAGVRAARGDVVAVVHADTRVAPPAFTRILRVLEKGPMIVGGALGGRFDGTGWRLRMIELANDGRSVFTGIHFGDQVQFFRRRPVTDRDLFPDIPLMEDVELSLRLQRLGRQVYLFGDARISPRTWQASGYRRAFKIVRLVAGYLLDRFIGRADPLSLYRKYYGAASGEKPGNKNLTKP